VVVQKFTQSPGGEIGVLFATAVRAHQAGRPEEAEQFYHSVLAIDPCHIQALQYLGILALQTGRPELAVTVIAKVLAENDRMPECHYNLALALRALNRVGEAIGHYRRALALKPDHLEAHVNLANALSEQCNWDQAVAHYQRALALKPDLTEAHNNLATALAAQGRSKEALIHYQRTLALNPNLADAYLSVGNLLLREGRFDEAAAQLERGLAISPNDPRARNSLGFALAARGKFEQAVRQFERALALAPDFIDAYNNLAQVFFRLMRLDDALGVLRRAIEIGATLETKSLFIQYLRSHASIPDADDLRHLMVAALSEPWARPNEVAPIAASLVKNDPTISEYVACATHAWPRRPPAQELLGPSGFGAISDCRLLVCLMESTPVCDLALERFLTAVRHAMLEVASTVTASTIVDEKVLNLACALARQCFLNEYVFDCGKEELDRAERLRDLTMHAIETGATVPGLWLAVVAAYFPLHSLSVAGGLGGKQWPDAVERLLVQQVREPEQERQLRTSMPMMTAIDDEVSVLVRQQYEENPYPRWEKAQPPIRAFTVDQFLRTKFPLADFRNLGKTTDVDILIAGCGTGQHAIETGQRIPASRILAIDLSLASLGYAARKTRALGLVHIEYAQADILKLASISRRFDVIEAGGVLHHLADPFAGWRTLLSLLRPGGVMGIGLYSELARAHVKAARGFIAERGYRPTAEEIRRCRQELIGFEDGAPEKRVTQAQDFFTTSECRDLLFHVQEHRHTLPEIAAFLAENELEFLGFELKDGASQKYRARFPDDQAASNLDLWQIYERENPSAFIGMYQFWVQKKAAGAGA
jgi:tetratricopeptide (TPR) repeat protein/SAM-dependent methyltransferase